MRTFIKTLVGSNIIVLSGQEYDHVRAEHRKNINAYEIPNGDDAIADVWDEHNPEQVPGTKHGKYQNSFLTDDDIYLSLSNNISNHLKKKIQNHKREVSLTVYHEIFTKHLRIFWLITNQNILMNLK